MARSWRVVGISPTLKLMGDLPSAAASNHGASLIPKTVPPSSPGDRTKSGAEPNMTAGSCKGSLETNNKLTGQSEKLGPR